MAAPIPVKRGEDPRSYRYLMPKVVVTSSLRSTSVLNVAEICHDIGRTPQCLQQWFAITFGLTRCPSEIQIRGSRNAASVQNSIYDFIEAFVICPTCGNPETLMAVKGRDLELYCRACGRSNPLRFPERSAPCKMAEWIRKNIASVALQEGRAPSDKPVESLDDFEDPRDTF
jgi:translation initiation factor 2 beta subunit (eIF-2beta)/eIF-5